MRKVVADAIAQIGVKTVVTFDRHGVSSHANHIAVSRALEGVTEVYMLVTYPMYQKYNPFTAGRVGSTQYRSGLHGWRRAQLAMTQGHRSQMRWFRWAWIILSRYMLTNDYYHYPL